MLMCQHWPELTHSILKLSSIQIIYKPRKTHVLLGLDAIYLKRKTIRLRWDYFQIRGRS